MGDCSKDEDEERMWKRGKILGKGGFGCVFLATTNSSAVSSSALPPLMAVKSVQLLEGDVSPAASLLEERYFLSHLPPSPHIIRFYGDELTLDQGQFYFNLFLEYASLGSLADRITQNTTLPEHEIKHYTRPLLHGLTHIHTHNLVHCDIKPDNILLVLDHHHSSSSPPPLPIPKIADFGLAKFVGEPLDTTHLRGTAFYLAPECIRCGLFEPPCDVWALGCVVLQMFTAKSVWPCNQNTSLPSLLHHIGYTDELPLIPTTISTQAQDFLKKCLVKDPSLRWTPQMLLNHPFLATQNSLPPLSQVLALNNNLSESERIDCTSGDDIGVGCSTSPICSATLLPCNNSFIPLRVDEKIEGPAHGLSYISLEVTNNTQKQKGKRTSDQIGGIPSKGGKRRKTPHEVEVHQVTHRPSLVLADTTYKYGPWTTEPHPFINAPILV